VYQRSLRLEVGDVRAPLARRVRITGLPALLEEAGGWASGAREHLAAMRED